MDPDIQTLTRKRGHVKARVSRIRNFVLSFSVENHSLSSLKSRREKLEECWLDFNAIQSAIDTLPSDEVDDQDGEYLDFENEYFEIRDKIEFILSKHETSKIPITTNSSSDVSDNIKLPDMPLPSFSGRYEDWTDFHDVFESMIHNSTKLTNIQKFYYLRSCLSGEALRTIKELKVTADNYEISWMTLNRRFKNDRLSIKAHVQGILNIKRLDKPFSLKLKHLYDTVSNHLTALSNLGEPTDQWGTLLVFLIAEKLDPETRDRWEAYHAKHVRDEYKNLEVGTTSSITMAPGSYTKPYSFKMLMRFIYEQCMIQEVREETYHTDIKVRSKETKHKFQPSSPVNKPSFHTFSVSKPVCVICSDGHATFTCKQLLSLNMTQRLDKVRELNLCLNCLRRGHNAIQCKSPHHCKHCQGRHHTVLHNDKCRERANPFNQVQTIAASSNISGEVLLATANILICDNQGDAYPCRALLDSGSQSNIISQSLVSALGLKTFKTNVSVNCVGNTGVSTNTFVRTGIKSRLGGYEEVIDFLVLGKITNDLPTSSNLPTLPIPGTVNLADDHFYKSRGVDVLLGASVFYNTLLEGHIKLGDNLPVIQNTSFGWVVSGTLPSYESKNKHHSTLNTVCCASVPVNLENLISAFWKLEEVPSHHKRSYVEEACEQHYKENVRRLPDGRYVVKLPFSTDPTVSLGESKDHAFRRFLALENKLNKNSELKENYTLFLNEYLENAEMERVLEDSEPDNVYYLPHHPVLKESSPTTKLRVVFDASSKTSTHKSLNDVLMVGPTIQRDLVSLLLSFRTHRYVFTADIKQMYRKVLLDKTHRDYQRILWRNDTTDPISVYRLKTVTYGIASAPFLAIRTLFQLAEDERQVFPIASETLKHDFYVDDVLTGADSLDQLVEGQRQLISLLEAGGFELRKWCANHPMILKNIPSEKTEAGFLIEEHDNKSTKVLGILWQPSNDTFQFHVSLSKAPKIVTKRVILSDISKIFDPIGLVSPVVIEAKLFMQEIWSAKEVGWDEPVPSGILKKWNVYRDSLQDLSKLAVERRVLSGTSNQAYEIHGFADASEKAYGACLYIRTIQENNNITVKLWCSKSRVAPLKQLTLPRLELCAALLLSQLLDKTLSSLKMIQIGSITLWTDSTIVLHWLNASPRTWQTFVANRVSQIHELTTNCAWKHVRSQDNPADLISRSTSAQSLIKSRLWWHGPQWLTYTETNWPKIILTTPVDSELEERKGKVNVHCNYSSSFELIERYSSWTKLLRITALCQRFSKNCKHPSNRTIGHLTPEDLHKAELVWIKSAQLTFRDDINRLQKGKTVSNNLKALAPYIDEKGILRVGGRLKHASITSEHRNPILLPSIHPVTRLIFLETHITTLHMGPQALLAAVRTKYWPIHGKVVARSIVRKCVKCNRSTPQAAKHLMGDLPACRVQPSRPFENCGVDFCGPFYYRRVLQRKSHPVKAYVGLFICMSTKAIHIELVPDLTTKKFLEALDRMIARRGKIKNIYSDNGTNFTGAKHELAELRQLFMNENHQYQLQSYCATASINWHFIPPYSPHFGGLWEAGVKTVKGHLKRVLGTHILSYDELETLLIKIEACVNSRPLTPLSSDPNDLHPLTPAHFLIGDTLLSFPVPDLTHLSTNRLAHWQHIQQLYQNFWKRWSNEYLSTLQQRNKWTKNYSPPQPGSLVIIREDFRPPLHWEIGRITELHFGTDGVARVATIRTSRGLIKRALIKLCPLPNS